MMQSASEKKRKKQVCSTFYASSWVQTPSYPPSKENGMTTRIALVDQTPDAFVDCEDDWVGNETTRLCVCFFLSSWLGSKCLNVERADGMWLPPIRVQLRLALFLIVVSHKLMLLVLTRCIRTAGDLLHMSVLHSLSILRAYCSSDESVCPLFRN